MKPTKNTVNRLKDVAAKIGLRTVATTEIRLSARRMRSRFQRGQLRGSLGSCEGCGTRTKRPDGSYLGCLLLELAKLSVVGLTSRWRSKMVTVPVQVAVLVLNERDREFEGTTDPVLCCLAEAGVSRAS